MQLWAPLLRPATCTAAFQFGETGRAGMTRNALSLSRGLFHRMCLTPSKHIAGPGLQSPPSRVTTQRHTHRARLFCHRSDFPALSDLHGFCKFSSERDREREETNTDTQIKSRQLQDTGDHQAEGLRATGQHPPHPSGERARTCEFWILIVPGDNAWVTTWPCGVTTVTGWYTVPP